MRSLDSRDEIESQTRENEGIFAYVTIRISVTTATRGLLSGSAIDEAGKDISKLLAEQVDAIVADRLEQAERDLLALEEFRRYLSEFAESKGSGGPVVFIIDELDRCRPDFALELAVISNERNRFQIMRIDHLTLTNFKCFEQQCFDLNPRFTLFVGDNGAGKTSVLDALAIAAGVWLVQPPDSTLAGSGRNILPGEIRLDPVREGDRTRFVERKPVVIGASGEIAGQAVSWIRQVRESGVRTSNAEAKEALALINDVYQRDRQGGPVLCPIIGYYGAGRAWLPSKSRPEKAGGSGPARRWDAFYDCFEERIRLGDLRGWFQREAIAFASRGGRWRPGYEAVTRVILRCIPGADALWFDGDRGDIALSINGQPQPFAQLSAGQRMMVALIADIAIKAVTQNAHLLPEADLEGDAEVLPRLFLETPGLILIDELDAHLHPIWQRRVVDDLRETFPAIQFVCTSHSPFIIQSLSPGELRTLDETGTPLVEYANQSIEDIAEGIQRVRIPQQSRRARTLAEATERYFRLLDKSVDKGSQAFKEAEREYRLAVERYSDNPGLSAFLKLKALAAEKEKDE